MMSFVKKFPLQISCHITRIHLVHNKALFSMKMLLWKAIEKNPVYTAEM